MLPVEIRKLKVFSYIIPATVRTVIIFLFTLYNFPLNVSQKVSKICQTVSYFDVTSSIF